MLDFLAKKILILKLYFFFTICKNLKFSMQLVFAPKIINFNILINLAKFFMLISFILFNKKLFIHC
jgi:hypothetical protein